MMQSKELIDKNTTKSSSASDETRHAIVMAAIRVVAAHGVEGASLRAINVAAGCRNSSATHYHFGTKIAMLEAAMAALYSQVTPRQEPLLLALEARAQAGEPVAVREILEAVYLPYLELMNQPEFGRTAAKFVSRLLVESDADIQALINRTVAQQSLRLVQLLGYACPEIPPNVIIMRLFITVTNVVHGAGDLDALFDSPLGDLTGGNPGIFIPQLFDYMTAAVSAPASSI